MTAQILDGKGLAQQIQAEIREEVTHFKAKSGVTPCLAAVLVGENPASEVYVKSKRKACETAGMTSQLHRLPATTTTDDLLALVDQLNRAAEVHGILVQLPLPEKIDATRVLDAVSPAKDVDGFHPDSVGRLAQGRPTFVPCTPLGVQQLLIRSGIATAGREAVVVGRSDIVGKPMALLLMQRGAGGDATVTVCHSRSHQLAEITRRADILIVAIGKARFVTADMVKPGAAVIDVGMNRLESGLCGDVDYDAVRAVAGHITPVPGGVGPLTVTMLLANTLTAARAINAR
jgi:methylenetetrahydrofolate dehydrogenase (NADP+)/methenyltetrahydrofolate cyclohydrolase